MHYIHVLITDFEHFQKSRGVLHTTNQQVYIYMFRGRHRIVVGFTTTYAISTTIPVIKENRGTAAHYTSICALYTINYSNTN